MRILLSVSAICLVASGVSTAVVASEAPTGMVSFFNLEACPDGWAKLADAEGRYLVGLSGDGVVGDTVGEALSAGENRSAGAHKHESKFVELREDPDVTLVASGSGAANAIGFDSTDTGYGVDADDNRTDYNVIGTNAPYLQLLVCTKQKPSGNSGGAVTSPQ